MTGSLDCRQVRQAIGGDPRHLAPDIRHHVEGCDACRQFHAEMLTLDGRIEAALQLPLHRFRAPTRAPTRRFALAASVMAALLVGGGAWLFRPQAALADELVEHLRHEAGSWALQQPLTRDDIAAVLGRAGVHFDSAMPVVYASPCLIRGRISPHLVVQTDEGPVTVILLAHEKVSSRQQFNENGYSGVLLPAGEGSVAVLTRGGAAPRALEAALLSAVRW